MVIVNMDVPESCQLCPISRYEDEAKIFLYCPIANLVVNGFEKKYPKCPIIGEISGNVRICALRGDYKSEM